MLKPVLYKGPRKQLNMLKPLPIKIDTNIDLLHMPVQKAISGEHKPELIEKTAAPIVLQPIQKIFESSGPNAMKPQIVYAQQPQQNASRKNTMEASENNRNQAQQIDSEQKPQPRKESELTPSEKATSEESSSDSSRSASPESSRSDTYTSHSNSSSEHEEIVILDNTQKQPENWPQQPQQSEPQAVEPEQPTTARKSSTAQ